MQTFGDFKRRRFDIEADYLKTFFPCLERIDAIILKLNTDGGFDNYNKRIGDPMKEKTLIIGDQDNNVLLFFKCTKNNYKVKNNVFEGVSIIRKYCFDQESMIHRKQCPVDVPLHLEKYVFDFALANSFCSLTIDENFFEKHYQKGGIVSLKEMKRHHEWKKEYEENICVKRVHMCKSCNQKWVKDCCSEYGRNNRIMLKMVIGWSKKI